MTDNTQKPQAIYTKNLPKAGGSSFAPGAGSSAGVPQAGGDSSNNLTKKPTKNPQKKIFGVNSKAVMAVLGLAIFFVVAMAGVLISQKQRISEDATAPSAPKSQPSADIIKPDTCTLTFTVPAVVTATPTVTPSNTPTPTPTPIPGACGSSSCDDVTNPCDTGLLCVTAADGNNYCALSEFENACVAVDDKDQAGSVCCVAPTNTPTPTPTPKPVICGQECDEIKTCDEGLVCTLASDGFKYCATPEFEDACGNNATKDSAKAFCCTAPTATSTPTNTPPPGATLTNTPPPGATATPTTPPQTVVTTVSCNNTCSVNSDCTNLSHICYGGRCRLDSNPEDTACKTATGKTTVVIAQPTLPPELPVSGFENFGNYIKIGLGALGAGILLLLFL